MNSPEGKSILALVRDGAYAHAGETEAIELTLSAIPKNPNRVVLDAGCGLGGTADYMQRHGWGRVTGFDIDAVSVAAARAKFSECTFAASDVGAVGELWRNEFDLITCFNTVYSFPRQPEALAELGKVARSGAMLVIFDYTDPQRKYAESDFALRADATYWRPLHRPTLENWCAPAGWQLLSEQDVTDNYLRWYQELVKRIERHRDEVITGHGEKAFSFVLFFYSALRDAVADGTIGGSIFTLTRG